jgi:VanZ family protein
VLGVLSLMPAEKIHRTNLGGHVEHVLAYAAAAVLVRLTQGKEPIWRPLLLLIVYAAALEYLQRFSPGRTPQVEDFLFSACGVLIGGSASYALRRVLPR